jgi:hypothetical protein
MVVPAVLPGMKQGNNLIRAWSASPKSMEMRYRAASGEMAVLGAWISRAHIAFYTGQSEE